MSDATEIQKNEDGTTNNGQRAVTGLRAAIGLPPKKPIALLGHACVKTTYTYLR